MEEERTVSIRQLRASHRLYHIRSGRRAYAPDEIAKTVSDQENSVGSDFLRVAGRVGSGDRH